MGPYADWIPHNHQLDRMADASRRGGAHVSNNPTGSAPPAEVLEPRTPGRQRTWAVVVAVVAGLLMCSCMSTLFLVLTGIIAEPVTVIEEILRVIHALVGG